MGCFVFCLPYQEPSPQADVHDLLRRYPVMWQGHFSLKNELAAVQLHLLSGRLVIGGASQLIITEYLFIIIQATLIWLD